MNRHLPWRIFGCGLVVYLLLPLLLNAEVTGSISGVVTDPSGAIVPNAVVILRSGDTGLERKIQANAQGAYEFLAFRWETTIRSVWKRPGSERRCKLASSSK